MRNNWIRFAAVFAALLAPSAALPAESESPRWIDVEFPRDSPVLTVSFSLSPSTSRVRGASIALDLHASLVLRNTSTRALSGLTLRVEAQDLLPAGKASLMVPSLDVQPGEVFPVRLDLQLTRPFNAAKTEGAMVQVSLDCAVFNDLSSYGPDRLKSRRALMVYELEARRDRQYMANLLKNQQYDQLRQELNFGLQDVRPQQLGFELTRDLGPGGRQLPITVNTMAFPGAPVRAIGGDAQISGNEIHTPRIELRNLSRKPVRSVDMGWIVRDERGRDFVAGSVPAATPLGPVETGVANETGTLRFSTASGQPLAIGALMAFVSNVEFADGNLWIPSRTDIEGATTDPVLRKALSSSPEHQRLAEVFRRKGIRGLAEELKRAQ
ncbi:MAG: hypothetical protein ACJ746_24125 [Bryobacteraceae bacterium]